MCKIANEASGNYVLILCSFNNGRKAISATAAPWKGKIESAVLSVLRMSAVKIKVLWVMTPCPLVSRHISEKLFIFLPLPQYEFSCLEDRFITENVGRKFLRNVGKFHRQCHILEEVITPMRISFRITSLVVWDVMSYSVVYRYRHVYQNTRRQIPRLCILNLNLYAIHTVHILIITTLSNLFT